MAELLTYAWDSSGHKVYGAIWCDGPRPGTKWLMVKIGDRNRNILIKKAPQRAKHAGEYVVVG